MRRRVRIALLELSYGLLVPQQLRSHLLSCVGADLSVHNMMKLHVEKTESGTLASGDQLEKIDYIANIPYMTFVKRFAEYLKNVAKIVPPQ